ncbi:MAG: Lrp/AsnC family transcriptional regulator [Peptococcaceae bacterium]|nr:Lrp/AsnC family transcriptional regulator [Peptococcaceae bacterium]
MREILELLESNAKLSAKEIATMLSMEEAEVESKIKEMEGNKIIIGYFTLVNWEKEGEEKVSAVIEVRMTPQRDVGFDAVAERISRFPEVQSVRLVSGTYDLSVTIEGASMREVNNFVATKLATIDGVVSTTTHFIMKTYKQDGVIIDEDNEDRRLVVSP